MDTYQKKYKEIFERAMVAYKDEDIHIKVTLERIFPELKESEDEKVRKEIIRFIQMEVEDEIVGNKWIAWLEKQNSNVDNANKEYWRGYHEGKQEILDKYAELEKQGEQKLTDNIETKFCEGDWITNDRYVKMVVGIGTKGDKPYYYMFKDGTTKTIDDIDKKWHLWTIQDAKPGDVLQLGNVTAIFKKYISNGNCKCYCSIYNGEFEIPTKDGADNSYGCHDAIPATKEQYSFLFQKMYEAGYEWNAEKKELKGIVDEEQIKKNLQDNSFRRMFEQKSAWSEEDSIRLQRIIDFLWYNRKGDTDTIYQQEQDIDWLKSFKDLNKCSYKFNEIGKEILNAAILFAMNSTDEFACNGVSKEDVIDLLKSLKQN